MKKYGLIILFLIGVSGLIFNENVEAAEQVGKIGTTEVGIRFQKADTLEDPIIEPPIISPTPLETPNIVKPGGRLPSTGELITSLIWIFLGLSILIIFVGVHSLRQVMIKIA